MCEALQVLRRFVFKHTTLHLVSQHRDLPFYTIQASIFSGRSNILTAEATSVELLLLT